MIILLSDILGLDLECEIERKLQQARSSRNIEA